MKSDQDFHEGEIIMVNTLPIPLNEDHNYFSVSVHDDSTAAWNCGYNYDGDVTSDQKGEPFVKSWKNLSDVTTRGKPRSDVTAIRNHRSDVIAAGKPSIDSINIMTYSDVTVRGDPPCDVIERAKYADDVIRYTGNPLYEIKTGQTEGISPENRASEEAADATDTSSPPYGMLIDVEAIGSLLLQNKAAMEPPRSGTRMKLDSRYRTNSSDSAFSEDSLLEDEDVKLENLISQFIFNPTTLQNDFQEYVESEENGPTEDVDGLDVTDLFSSADIFGPDLGDPTSPEFTAAAEHESGWEESSENSICSDNRDNSPVTKHKTHLFQKKDSISSLSSSSSSSSTSSSSSSSSASLSLSSLSLDALSSSTVVQSVDDPHSAFRPSEKEEEALDEGLVDSETVARSLAGVSSSSMGFPSKGDNSDEQGDDSTGFLTLPLAHFTTTATKTTRTINSKIINNNNNNINENSNDDEDDDDDDKDNYEMLLNHLRNGFQPPFEIRGDNSDLMLDEPDFVEFPFPTETQNCRPNRPDLLTGEGIELNGDPSNPNPAGSLVGIHDYETDAFKARLTAPVVGGENVLENGSLATAAVLYLANPPPRSFSADACELPLNDVDFFTDDIDLDPKTDAVDECYVEPVLSQPPFITDWFSVDDSRMGGGLIDSAFHSTLSLADDCEPKDAKQRKSNDTAATTADIVQFINDSSSSSSTLFKTPQQKHSSPNINDVQSQTLKSGETPKSVRLLCSVKKCASSKRPVQTLNVIKKVPHKKKSASSQNKTLPVSVNCHERKTINCLNMAPIRGTPQLNRTEFKQSKSTHSSPRIEIVSWDDTGSFHVKVPKLSLNNKQSRNTPNRVQCSLLREALTAEEPQPRFFKAAKEGKHKNTKASKLCRVDSSGFPNEGPLTQTQNNGSEMSELEKYLRGLIPTEAENKELGRTSGSLTSCVDDLSQISFLRKLLTGEMSTHAYREIDRRICEKQRREIK